MSDESSAAQNVGVNTDTDGQSSASGSSVGVGVPAVILLIVFALLMWQARCRRVDGVAFRHQIARNLPVLWSWSIGSGALALTALILTLVWGGLLSAAVRPASIGVAVIVLLPAIVFVLAGTVLWADRGWRLALVEDAQEDRSAWEEQKSDRKRKVGAAPTGLAAQWHELGEILRRYAPEICFVVAAVLVLVYEIAVVYAGQVASSVTTTESADTNSTDSNSTVSNSTVTNSTEDGNSTSRTTTDEDILGGYRYSFLVTSWVFVGVNALLVVLVAHFLTHAEEDGAVEGEGGDAAEKEESVKRAELAHLAHSPLRLLHEAVKALVAPLEAGEDGEEEEKKKKKGGHGMSGKVIALGLYVLAVVVLLVYSITNWVLSDDPVALGSNASEEEYEDQGAFLGFAAAGVLLLGDIVLFGAWSGGLIPSPGVAGFVVAATRALVLAFGARWWLLGHSAVYAALGFFLADRTVSRYMFVLDAEAASKASSFESGGGSGGRDSRRDSSGESASSEPSKAVRPPAPPLGGMLGPINNLGDPASRIAVFTAPGSLLILCTLAFTLWVGLFSMATGGVPGFPSAKVTLIDRPHEQWVFGLGALVLVIIFLGARFASAFYHRDGGKLSAPDTSVAVTILCIGTAGLGALLFIATQSFALLSSMLFLPAAATIAAALVGQWQADDYTVILPGGISCGPPNFAQRAQDRANPSPPGTPAAANTGGAASPAAPARSDHREQARAALALLQQGDVKGLVNGWFVGNAGRNAAMVIGAIMLPIVLISFALTLNAGFSPNASILGWYITAELFALFFTFLPVRMWFGTLEFNIFIPITAFLAAVAHFIGHGFLIAAFEDTSLLTDYFNDEGARSGRSPRRDQAVLAGVFSMCLYPALVLTAIALYKWKDDRWKGSNFVYWCLGLSQLTIFAFFLAGIFVYDAVAITVGVLVAYLFVACVVSLIVYARINRGYVPPRIAYSAAGILGSIVLIGIGAAIWQAVLYAVEEDQEDALNHYAQAIILFSVAYWLLAGTVLCYGILVVYRGGLLGAETDDGSGANTGLGSAEQMLVAAANVPEPLIVSRGFLPVFSIKTQGSLSIEMDNRGVLAVCAAGVLAIAFGLIASALASPAYAGLIISTMAQVLLLLFVLSVLRNAGNTLARAVTVIVDDSSLQDKEEAGGHDYEEAKKLAEKASKGAVVPLRLAAAIVRAADRWISGYDASSDARKNDFDGSEGISASGGAPARNAGPGAAGGDSASESSSDRGSLSAAVKRVAAFLKRGSVSVRTANTAILAALAAVEQSHKRGAFVSSCIDLVQSPAPDRWNLDAERVKVVEKEAANAIRAFATAALHSGSVGVLRFPDSVPGADGRRASGLGAGAVHVDSRDGDEEGNGISVTNPLRAGMRTNSGSSASKSNETCMAMLVSSGFPKDYLTDAEEILAAADEQVLGKATAPVQSSSSSSGSERPGSRALRVLRALHHALDLCEVAVSSLHTEEARVLAGVRMATVSAGAAAAEGLAQRWRQFLAWADRVAMQIEEIQGVYVVPRNDGDPSGSGDEGGKRGGGISTSPEVTEGAVDPFQAIAKEIVDGGDETQASLEVLLEVRRLKYWSQETASTAAASTTNRSVGADDASALADAQRRLQGLGPALQRALTSPDELTVFWSRSIGRHLANRRVRAVRKLQKRRQEMLRKIREDAQRKKEQEEEERRRREAIRQRQLEEEARRRKEEEERRKLGDEEARKRREEERRREEEKRQEEERKRIEEERRRLEEQKRKEEERRRKEEEEEARRRKEEEDRRKAEEQRRKAEEERRKEEAERLKREEERRKEEERKAAEEEERRKKELEEIQRRQAQAEEEEKKRLEEERRRIEAERQRVEEERRRIEAERERQRKEREEAEKRRQEAEEQRRREEAERQRKLAEERKKREEERKKREEERIKREQELKRLEEERKKREEEERIRREKEEAEEEERRKRAAAGGGGGGGGAAGGSDAANKHGPWDEKFHKAEIARIKEEAARIARSVPAGQKWTDSSFGPKDYFVGTNEEGKDSPFKWERYKDKKADAVLLTAGAKANDISQGQLGDCWFCSSLAIAAEHEYVEKLVLVSRDEDEATKKGVYAVRFCMNREWVTIFVDETMPWTWSGPALMKSTEQKEMWPAIVEKAFAKFYGGYKILSGGQPHHSLAQLTGFIGESVNVDSRIKETSTNALFEYLVECSEKGCLMCCASGAGSDSFTNADGIVLGHAFSLLFARRVNDGRGNTFDVVKVRNPHARTEFTGPLSDGDRGRWTKRLMKELDHDPAASGDDGVWCMFFRDFVSNFRVVYIAHPMGFTSSPSSMTPSPSDYVYTAQFDWIPGETAGGVPNSPKCDLNPNYYLKLTGRTRIRIALSLQMESKGFRSGGHSGAICVVIMKKGGKRVKFQYVGEKILGTSWAWSDEVMTEGVLEPDSAPYTIFPYTDATDKLLRFVITVVTDKPLADVDGHSLRQIPKSVPAA